MKKIFLLHCFPVPYRNHLFQSLAEEAERRNVKFEVQFFDRSDESRPTWKFESKDLQFPHKFWNPVFKKGPVLHLNPDLLLYLRKEKPDLIISGGVWSSLNSILLTIFSKTPIIAWDEANRNDFGSVQGNYVRAKRFLIEKLRYFAIPGKESWYYYRDMLAPEVFKQKKFLNLPNLVDEGLFNQQPDVNKLKLELSSHFKFSTDKKIIYWPARFIKDKGIENFINYLSPELLKGWLIILVGNGPLESSIINCITKRRAEEHFVIINTLPYEVAVKFYYIADLLIMPSLSDSNPLSLIEAIHSSLPIAISKRVGNLNEVLLEGVNGVSLDPYSETSVKEAINYILNLELNVLKLMGKESKKIAMQNFTTEVIIKSFFDDIFFKYQII